MRRTSPFISILSSALTKRGSTKKNYADAISSKKEDQDRRSSKWPLKDAAKGTIDAVKKIEKLKF